MKALIVGQAPSQATDGRAPFTGRSGANLAALLGVPQRDLPRTVDLVNLVPYWPGKTPRGKGDLFPRAEARAAAAMLVAVAPHDRIVLCGQKVADAFFFGAPPFLSRVHRGGRTFLILPHPSSIVRWWNDPANVKLAGETLREFVSADLRAAI